MSMIDGRKNRKDFMSIVCETYKEFAENTSIHGLKYTVRRDIALYEKIFWILVVLAGLGGSVYMTSLFWSRYTSNPTRTSIMTTHAPTTTVPFPAVTICNINRIIHSKVEDFARKMEVSEGDEETVKRALPQLMAFASPNLIEYNYTDLRILQDNLVKNDYTDIRFVMRKIAPSCNEMLMKCEWNFTTIPCSRIFEESMTLDGSCCSFNYIPSSSSSKSVQYSSYSGMDSGLSVLLNPIVQEKQYLSLHSSGVKVVQTLEVKLLKTTNVLVHHAFDYPGVGSISKIVSGGRQSYLQVMASKIITSNDIKRLSVNQRQCAYPEEQHLNFFDEYGDTNCLTECDIKHFRRKCGCVPYYLPFKGLPVCNVTDIPCLHNARKMNASENLKGCVCAAQCEDDIYSVLSTSVPLNPNIKGLSATFLTQELMRNITTNHVFVQVFFSSQRQTILFRDTITSTIYLLSSFGGVYSLFLGCSFITIVEILYYCSFRFIVNLKIFGQINKTPVIHKEIVVSDKKKPKDQSRRTNGQKLWPYEGNVFLN